MTRFLHIPCLLALLVFPVGGRAESVSNPVLARDDHYEYTLQDLADHLRLAEHPSVDRLPALVKAEDSSAIAVAEKRMAYIAFQRLLVRREAGDSCSSPTKEYVRGVLRDYAYDRFLSEATRDVVVSPEEVAKSYERNKDRFVSPERRKLSILYRVFPPDPQGRQEIVQELEQLRRDPGLNERFLEEVKKRSDLPNALQGGVVDYFTTGTYGPTVEKYAFSTPPGELSPVFWASKGAYILKVLDVLPGGPLPLEKARATLEVELRQEHFEALLQSRLRDLKNRYSPWVVESIPGCASADMPLLRVGDYVLTSGTLLVLHPELAGSTPVSDAAFRGILETILVGELLLRDLEAESRKSPNSPKARELDLKEILAAYPLILGEMTRPKISVTESEKREYYEKHRDFYHDVAPKRLRCVLFRNPAQDSLPEQEYYRDWTERKRMATGFLARVENDTNRFEAAAAELANEFPFIEVVETDFLVDWPKGWDCAKTIASYAVGKISPLVTTPEGFVVFRVVDQDKPRIFTYKEVEPSLHRVVYAQKEEALRAEMERSILERYHYRFVLGK